jgi:hypothetical protein
MSPELTLSRIDETLNQLANRSTRNDDLLPLWLSREEAESFLQLCAASPALVSEEAEAELFGKLGQLLRAFQR